MAYKITIYHTINPIQDAGVGKKAPFSLPVFLSTVTSPNVEISPQNFLIFSFNLFTTLL